MEIVITQPTQCDGKRTDGSKPVVIIDTPGVGNPAQEGD